MTSRRISGGLHDFVDEHDEYGLNEEEEKKFKKLLKKSRKKLYGTNNPQKIKTIEMERKKLELELKKQQEEEKALTEKIITGTEKELIRLANKLAKKSKNKNSQIYWIEKEPNKPAEKKTISIWKKIKKKLGI